MAKLRVSVLHDRHEMQSGANEYADWGEQVILLLDLILLSSGYAGCDGAATPEGSQSCCWLCWSSFSGWCCSSCDKEGDFFNCTLFSPQLVLEDEVDDEAAVDIVLILYVFRLGAVTFHIPLRLQPLALRTPQLHKVIVTVLIFVVLSIHMTRCL